MSTYEIVHGPNTDRVLDSLKYAYDRTADVGVDFVIMTATGKATHPAKVVSLQYESGSPGMFILTVDFTTALRRKELFYNSNTRRGTILG